ncbi:MAG: monovalent cation/H+ antiporter complex subunit F [Candidatus Bipolaricaulota bacterium]|nr:monovalent cation/H+ antiporter complex subunit F [Candidatus Bipolaricaulota bacterium]
MVLAEIVLGLSLAVVLYRLIRGPTPWDRLLSYNSASNRVFIILAVIGIVTDRSLYVNVAILYAALSFLGVVVLARFMERGGGHR